MRTWDIRHIVDLRPPAKEGVASGGGFGRRRSRGAGMLRHGPGTAEATLGRLHVPLAGQPGHGGSCPAGGAVPPAGTSAFAPAHRQ